MAQKEALYTVELFNGKEAVGLQSAISARTALAAIKTAIKEHNRVASRKGSGMRMATRGRIWSILADGKITRLRKPKNPATTDKRKCANCGKMFTPDNPNDKSENVCSRACVREFVLRGGKGRRKNATPRKQNARTSTVNEATLIFSPREIDRVVIGTESGAMMLVLKDGRSVIRSKRGWEFEDTITSGEVLRRKLIRLYGE